MNSVLGCLQPSLKFWGEEEIDGAIYMIYLKKVRYHHCTNDSIDQISHLEWETVRVKVIKAGTLEKLVEGLATDNGELDSTYMNIFLSTYRSFASPNQVLSILLHRYEQIYAGAVQLSSKYMERCKQTFEKVILVWLDMYSEDFFEPPQFLSLLRVKEFAHKYASGSLLEMRAKHKLQKFSKENFESSPINYPVTTKCATAIISRFLEIPENHFALQLTYADNELFKKLLPHHCLGSVWSRRNKDCSWNVSPTSVTATVNQFNSVSLRVISTILLEVKLKPTLRAEIISRWITIAQELRLLKNFSSLKAITAALQSNSVHRLTKVWHLIQRDKVEAFTELAKIFSEENNQTNCRELLIKEGSAKFADIFHQNSKLVPKNTGKQTQEYTSLMQGTIPYLGTFLTDLTMIDAAIPDYLPNGLINFDKRRKEFEILAQIKLLQSSANNYDIQIDTSFHTWFQSITVLSEKESYELSCLIQPLNNTARQFCENVKSHVKYSHQKCDSSSSTSSSNEPCFEQNYNAEDLHFNQHLNCSSSLPSSSSISSQDYYIIKVTLDGNDCSGKQGVNMYKSIMVNNQDHTRTVVMNAMMKHGLCEDPDSYSLIQLIPGGEIVFPNAANVYYAMNPAHELNFILRPRSVNDGKSKKKFFPKQKQ